VWGWIGIPHDNLNINHVEPSDSNSRMSVNQPVDQCVSCDMYRQVCLGGFEVARFSFCVCCFYYDALISDHIA
jgi:hypothetical protein